eukprot:g13204.t1
MAKWAAVCLFISIYASVAARREGLVLGFSQALITRGTLVGGATPAWPSPRSRVRSARHAQARAKSSSPTVAKAFCRGVGVGVRLEAARDGSGEVEARERWGLPLTRGRERSDWGRGRGAAARGRRERPVQWALCSSFRVSSPIGARNVTAVVGGLEAGEGGTLIEEAVIGSGGVGGGSTSGGAWKRKQGLLKTLWDFSRPHTMIGTAVAIPAIGVFAGPPGVPPGRRFFLSMVWAMVPSLLINVYITGLNQITDVEIDKVNKPYLPIPAGNLTPRGAKTTVSLCLLAGTALGLWPCSLGSPGLALTVVLSVLIGTFYSLPPVRLKRFPQVAALCILVVRGSIINGGFYSHAQLAGYGLAGSKTAWWALTLPFRDAKCALALSYFTVFAVVIALMKDVPDVEGDRMFNIPSFSVVLGEKKLFAFARRLLTTLLWSTAAALGTGAKAAATAGLPLTAASRGFVAAWALVFGQTVRRRATKTNPEEPAQVYKFYMFLWKIFYVSYLFLPLAR